VTVAVTFGRPGRVYRRVTDRTSPASVTTAEPVVFSTPGHGSPRSRRRSRRLSSRRSLSTTVDDSTLRYHSTYWATRGRNGSPAVGRSRRTTPSPTTCRTTRPSRALTVVSAITCGEPTGSPSRETRETYRLSFSTRATSRSRVVVTPSTASRYTATNRYDWLANTAAVRSASTVSSSPSASTPGT